jgi:hypothetical protein
MLDVIVGTLFSKCRRLSFFRKILGLYGPSGIMITPIKVNEGEG